MAPWTMHVRSASDQQLRAWTSDPLSLVHVRALLCVLAEHHHHLASSTLHRLLDAFLALADAYGTFRATLLVLSQHASELRAAVRRQDPAKVASAARAQRRDGKDLVQLASAVSRFASSPRNIEIDVARAINDTAVASASVFLEVASLADAAAASSSKKSSTTALEKLEHCIGQLESESDKVFRSLVQTRVSLLNIHTPTLTFN